MNHLVPELDMDEDYSIPPSSGLAAARQKKSMQDDGILELLWQNGQVVVQSQNQRLQRKSSPQKHHQIPLQPPPDCDSTTHLFDEIIPWLNDPPFDRGITDLFYLPPPALRPPPPDQVPFRRDSGLSTSSRNNEVRESMVDSSDTPAIRQKTKGEMDRENPCQGTLNGGCMSLSMDIDTCDLTLTSSGSGASLSATATADLMTLPPADDRKRKGREAVDEANTEYQSEEAEIESYEPKKQTRGVTTKRSRAAEVHNLSERRRRDRINEKMKSLQELIPRCSKTDKASMLDEAIEYLKSLQMQVQMMSMGCGMVPMMFPGVQQYMPSMGMGMSMEMGMARQMMQFPSVLSGSAMPTPGAPSHLNQRFPLQAFQMPPIPDPSSIQQASNQGEFNVARIPSLTDSYQQCNGIQQSPMQIPQNQPTLQPSIGKPSANPPTG